MKLDLEIPSISYPIQVMFFDTDLSGMVHNLAYLRFVETARTILAEHMGMNFHSMAGTQLFPVIVRTEVDYKRAAVVSEHLIVESRLDKIERTRMWFETKILRASDDTLLVSCRQMLALVQMPSGRPSRISAEFIERFSYVNTDEQEPALQQTA